MAPVDAAKAASTARTASQLSRMRRPLLGAAGYTHSFGRRAVDAALMASEGRTMGRAASMRLHGSQANSFTYPSHGMSSQHAIGYPPRGGATKPGTGVFNPNYHAVGGDSKPAASYNTNWGYQNADSKYRQAGGKQEWSQKTVMMKEQPSYLQGASSLPNSRGFANVVAKPKPVSLGGHSRPVTSFDNTGYRPAAVRVKQEWVQKPVTMNEPTSHLQQGAHSFPNSKGIADTSDPVYTPDPSRRPTIEPIGTVRNPPTFQKAPEPFEHLSGLTNDLYEPILKQLDEIRQPPQLPVQQISKPRSFRSPV
ncbi:hypothetical protein PCANC_14342 [Puccinia coronata f. sp. avenae]|uniref:Uncharacterized protein n=2 Tax=Puccinia coronata f. sp. avenae TaxID=200324 RepID=A0A2N5SYG5_9BASI|nr:hypothetical protein PCANC_14342 [Puccinia coronata f. sp. avenae]PLW18262.1 hypothetical protein PCASD_16076 [Puccinia coronata f. sp. avenae]PLW46815.1 hypothetical protein PCASD_06004 [Puccinia coronata f. sp. avenae]